VRKRHQGPEQRRAPNLSPSDLAYSSLRGRPDRKVDV
jgi:hypothetical protein